MGLRTLSLCAGGGGLDLALRLAIPDARTVCWVEWEAFAIAHLVDSMEAGWLDAAPLWTDLRTFDGKPWRGSVDCIIGGYPCQPFSTAGLRAGADDPRHLWPEVRRVVQEVQPSLCVFENVAGHLSLGFDTVERELRELGYRVTAGLFTAAEVGASHRRERLFILAVADSLRPGSGQPDATPEPSRHGENNRVSGQDGSHVADQSGLGRGTRGAEPGGEQGRPDAPECSGAMADPERGPALQAAAGRTNGANGTPATRPSGTVGDPSSPRCGESAPCGGDRTAGHADHGGPSEPERRGDDVAYRLCAGCEGRGSYHGAERRQEPDGHAGLSGRVFPPGPGDLDQWAGLLTECPDYAPAQSALCLASHGVAATRRHWLRLLGNGVSPLQGAYAITTLLLAALHADSVVGDD